ncbi:hypothetical protein BKA70DRAFT_1218715 [Coprinopsis sp. MPI-PUGE-AT-0042]|nr:hypothetical protein BKA70DRAFT_1218715 [Coprinopsis sp. MPI-PUGE-AT-0042]
MVFTCQANTDDAVHDEEGKRKRRNPLREACFWLDLVLCLVPDVQEPATGTGDQRIRRSVCFWKVVSVAARYLMWDPQLNALTEEADQRDQLYQSPICFRFYKTAYSQKLETFNGPASRSPKGKMVSTIVMFYELSKPAISASTGNLFSLPRSQVVKKRENGIGSKSDSTGTLGQQDAFQAQSKGTRISQCCRRESPEQVRGKQHRVGSNKYTPSAAGRSRPRMVKRRPRGSSQSNLDQEHLDVVHEDSQPSKEKLAIAVVAPNRYENGEGDRSSFVYEKRMVTHYQREIPKTIQDPEIYTLEEVGKQRDHNEEKYSTDIESDQTSDKVRKRQGRGSKALADRPQLQPLYTLQRPADQNYPSPSPSVPSPGPRLSPQLDLASQTLGGFPSEQPSDFSSRESDVGPVRSLRNHQYAMDYRPSRRTSMSDPQERMLPQSHLSMNSDGHLPFQPGTPESIGSHYAAYGRSMTSAPGQPRLPSPASSSRSYMPSGSGTPVLDVPEYLAHLSQGTAPRLKKHTKKKLDGLDKKRICLYHANHSNARQEDIAELFGVERSTVSKILKNKEEWLNVDENAVPSVKYRRHASPEPDSPADGDHTYRRSRDASERVGGHQESSSWHSSSYRGIPSLVDRNLPSPLYGSSRDPVDDESQSPTGEGSGEVETLLYLPPAYPSAHHQVDDYSKLPGQRGPPTIHDAEQAVEVLMTFLDNAPEKLIPRVITLEERDVLRHIKTQLCRITLGMPLASRKNS